MNYLIYTNKLVGYANSEDEESAETKKVEQWIIFLRYYKRFRLIFGY